MESNFPLSCGDFSKTVYGEIALYFFDVVSRFIYEHQGQRLGKELVIKLNGFIDEEVKKVPAEKIEQWGLPVEQWTPIAKHEHISGRYAGPYGRPPVVVYTGPHRFVILDGMFFN